MIKYLKHPISLVCFAFILSFCMCLWITYDRYYAKYSVSNGTFRSPSMAVEPQLINFGDVSAVDDLRREITVKNTSNRNSLIIERVVVACASDFVIHSYTQEPILPGEEGKVEFTLVLSRPSGYVETPFLIITNAAPQKIAPIFVSANILANDG